MAIHSVCSATAAHWLAPRQTASRRKAGSRNRLASSSISFESALPCARRRSGTHSHSTRLASTVTATSSRNTWRQSSTRSSSSNGTVAVIAPSAPAAKVMPFMVARRSGGYQSTNAVKEDIRQPETPTPISARAPIAAPAECAEANHSPPSAAMSSSVALTRRGPKRSSSRPSGSWKKANERK